MAFDPLSLFSFLGPIGSLVGGLAGQGAASADRERARQVLQQIMDEYRRLPTNPLTAQEVGASAMEEVQANPALVAAQMDALGALQDEGSGNSLQSRAELELGQQEASRRAGAERAAVENMLRNRGLGGSGSAVALRIGGARDAANTAANTALQNTVASRQRALQAMMQSGQLAGRMREQGFSEGASRASAKDMLARYNADARRSAQMGNAQYGLQRLGGMGRVAGDMSSLYTNDADRTQRMGADIGTGLGAAGVSFGQSFSKPAPEPTEPDNPYYHSYPRRLR